MVAIPEGFGQASVIFPKQAGLPQGAVFTFGVGNVDEGTALTGVNAIKTAITSTGMHNLWCDDVAPVSINLKLGPTVEGPSASVAYTEAGGQTGTVGAAATSILVRKRSLFGGPKNRGRMYIPGQSESAIDIGGIVGTATLTDAQSRCDAFLTALTEAAWPMVILHTAEADAPVAVEKLEVEAIVGNQRRRQRR